MNPWAKEIEKAEFKIRQLVRDGVLVGEPTYKTRQKVNEAIKKCLSRIGSAELRRTAEQSLQNLFYRTYSKMQSVPSEALLLILAAQKVNGGKGRADIVNSPTVTKTQARDILDSFGVKTYGNAANMYAKDYINRRVKPVLDELARMQAKDDRQSLRNKAEMTVRWEAHKDNRAELERQGVRLVIVSAHADCSDRCRPWQGRVYSLDGTSGTTKDGRKYVPIEVATNIYAKSASGKTYPYFNGLFGFNCRHYMMPFVEGMKLPMLSAKEQKREYAITERQRKYERDIRKLKAKAEMFKGVDNDIYSKNIKKAVALEKQYAMFSAKNDRARYPDRTKLI